MLHRLAWSDALVFIVNQHFAEQVEAFRIAAVFVFIIDESSPRHYVGSLYQSCRLCWQIQSVGSQVILETFSSKHVDNPRQLVEVVSAFEKCINFKEHACQSAAKRPNIERVVVEFVFDKQLRTFVVA